MNRVISTNPRTSSARRIAAVCAAISACALVFAAPALAQDPISAQYDNSVVEVESANSNSTPPVSTSEPSPAQQESGLQKSVISGLPFTGLDVIALAAVALALASIGLALRKLSSPSHG